MDEKADCVVISRDEINMVLSWYELAGKHYPMDQIEADLCYKLRSSKGVLSNG